MLPVKIKSFFDSHIVIISVSLILLFTSSIWALDSNLRRNYLNRSSETILDEAVSSFLNEMDDHIEMLDLMHDIWLQTDNISHLFDQDRYINTVQHIYKVTPGLLAINWIDANATIQWIYPYETNIDALGQNIRYYMSGNPNEAFQYAETHGEMGITGLVNLFQGGYGAVTYDPLIFNDTITGYFNGVFDFTILFKNLYEQNDSVPGLSSYSMKFINGEQGEIYQFNENFTLTENLVYTKDFELFNIPLTLVIRPNEQLRSQVQMRHNIHILGFGLILSGVIGALATGLKKKISIIRKNAAEHEKLIEALNIKQKMESLGTLAGGIAHDFNNLLAGIKGEIALIDWNLKELQQNPSEKGRIDIFEQNAEYIQDIIDLINRSEKMTKQILGFSKNKTNIKEIVDAKNIADEAISSFSNIIDKNIDLQFISEIREGVYILGEKSQLFQVFMNLLINARDAIEKDGLIILKCLIRKRTIDLTQAQKNLIEAKNEKSNEEMDSLKIDRERELVIIVQDNGKGIPSNFQDQIYDPFFTTKRKEGKGSGLGLTIVYNAIQKMGGQIEFISQIEKGTEFYLTLPILKSDSEQIHISFINQSLNLEYIPNFKNMTILIIEDEKIIQKSLLRLFEQAQASVWQAKDGEKGFKLYKEFPNQIDLVILDVNLPKLNGIEIFNQIQQINPNQAIIFMTGYSDFEIPSRSNIIEIIKKPFNMQYMIEIIEDWWNTKKNAKE